MNSSKQISPNTVVTLTYSLEIEDKETPDWFSRPMRINFLFGRDPLMPLVEQALIGRSEGEEFTVTIPQEQAYGPYDERLLREVDVSQLRHPEMIKVGEYYQEVDPATGRQNLFLVKEQLSEDKILADFNHPAAGHNVIMRIRVDEVREATSFDYLACDARNCGGG